MPLSTAKRVGAVVAERLSPHAHRVLVAGSVRRGRPEVRDLDIVVCPRFDADLGGGFVGWTAGFLASVREFDACTLETKLVPTSRGVTLRSRKSPGLKIELWLCTPPQFGWIATLRTGPAEFGHELVSLAAMGTLYDEHGPGYRFADGWLKHRGKEVETPDEETLFARLGLPFVGPAERSAAFLHRAIRERRASA